VWPVGALDLRKVDAYATGLADFQERRTCEEPAYRLRGSWHCLDGGYEPVDDVYEGLTFSDQARAIDESVMAADELGDVNGRESAEITSAYWDLSFSLDRQPWRSANEGSDFVSSG
jgi:hypothetical protein